MLSARALLFVMFGSSFIVALLSLPNPVVALQGFKHWSKKALYAKVDLCTEACYSQILPGLYLSNAQAARDRNVLEHLKITHVLTIEAHRLPKSTFEGSNISTLFIRAYDLPSTNLLPYFPMANAFIEEGLQKGNVLVHCHFGVSRSATLVIAYIMQKYNLSFEQAYVLVRQRRRFINPNNGFCEQLRDYYSMGFDVSGLQRLEAFVNVQARRHKYKIASAAAAVIGILVPLAVLVSFKFS